MLSPPTLELIGGMLSHDWSRSCQELTGVWAVRQKC